MFLFLSGRKDSNFRPLGPKPSALPTAPLPDAGTALDSPVTTSPSWAAGGKTNHQWTSGILVILPIHLILIFRILHSTLQFHLSRWKCLTSMVYFFVIGEGLEPTTACTDQLRRLGRSSSYALPDHIIKNTHRMLRTPCHTMLPWPNNFDPVKLIGISEPITHHILILFVVVLTLFTILELLQVHIDMCYYTK